MLSKTPIKQNHIIIIFLVLGFLFFSIIILDVPPIEEIWNFFGDPLDYQTQSKADFFSQNFFAPAPSKWFSPRPFTVPLLYKLAGSDAKRMFMFQKYFYCICVFIFIISINRSIVNGYLKIISSFLLLFFFTWWNIVGWSNNILSESISFSFFILWLAVFLSYYRNKNIIKLIYLIGLSILFSFSRDTWPYLIMLVFLFMLIIDVILKNKTKFWSVSLVIFSVVLFLIQGYTIKVGERSVLPVFNTLAGRISKNQEHLNWFIERGMPQGNKLRDDFRDVEVDSPEGRAFIYKRYSDSTYTELFTWIKLKGKNTYQKFLLSHFQYLILNDQTPEQLDRIFAYNIYNYYQKPIKFFLNADNIFPVFNVYVVLILVLICLWLWTRSKKFYLIFPALLSLIIFVNVYFAYNADTLEVQRHLYLTTIGKELIGLISSLFIVNYLFENMIFEQKNKIRALLIKNKVKSGDIPE